MQNRPDSKELFEIQKYLLAEMDEARITAAERGEEVKITEADRKEKSSFLTDILISLELGASKLILNRVHAYLTSASTASDEKLRLIKLVEAGQSDIDFWLKAALADDLPRFLNRLGKLRAEAEKFHRGEE